MTALKFREIIRNRAVPKFRDANLNAASMYLCKCDTERSLLSRSAMLRLASEERRRQVDRSRGNENRNGPLTPCIVSSFRKK